MSLPRFLLARIDEDTTTPRPESEAKRRVVELAVSVQAVAKTPYEHGKADGLDYALRLLALPYADHPDHREAWRP